jgi:hypothetical protein
MKRLLLAIGLLLPLAAQAQPYQVVASCDTINNSGGVGSGMNGYMDTTGHICVTGGSTTGTISVNQKPITWIAPTSGSITTSATVVAAGPTVSVITNTTGGARLTLNLTGAAAVDNVGIPLNAGDRVTIQGQPAATAINGICSSGTCTFTAQSGS